jgi:hypothetical protein
VTLALDRQPLLRAAGCRERTPSLLEELAAAVASSTGCLIVAQARGWTAVAQARAS